MPAEYRFTTEDVRNAADEVIAALGPRWCYASTEHHRREPSQDPRYRFHDEPQCLVGEIWERLLPDKVPVEGCNPFDQPFSDRFTDAALDLLDTWLMEQDDDPRLPWSVITGSR